MKTIISRVLAFLLAVLLVLPMTACGNGGDAAVTTDTPETTAAPETDPPTTGPLTLMEDATGIFTLIRAEFPLDEELDAALEFNSRVKALTGTSLRIATDFAKTEADIDPTALEILVGETNRSESIELMEKLPAMTFAIKTTDTKVIIVADDYVNMPRAIDYFFANCVVEAADGKFTVERGIEYISEPYNQFLELLPTADTFTVERTAVVTLKRPADEYVGPQGGWTDGVYHYQAWVDTDHETDQQNNLVRIVKTEMATGKVVKVSDDLLLNHANDITYNTKLNQLVVVHNHPNYNTVSFIAPETLELVETGRSTYMIFGLSYSAARDQYVAGISGTHNFTLFNGDLSIIRRTPSTATERTKGYTSQGITSDENFIYMAYHNPSAIAVYDWDGNFVTLIEVDTSDLGGNMEPENISVVDNYLYLTVYGKSTVIYRLTPVPKSAE